MGFRVALPESVIGLPVGEQRLHALHFEFHLDIGGKPPEHFLHGAGHLDISVQRGTDGGEQMGVGRVDDMFIVKVQGPDERGFQL